ncbi:MAG: glutamate 5-kinase [Gammaproteobacteria bacterium]|nr:MAG: glutamate 5-kinase [Gammaproteobacteria bacterium]
MKDEKVETGYVRLGNAIPPFRKTLGAARRVVVKIGSALLTNNGKGLDSTGISAWVGQMVALRKSGVEVVLVSSGSVAEGMTRLGLKTRPRHVHELQAAAAVGQMGLIKAYETHFKKHAIHTAQILLTHDDLSDRKRYLNARSTLSTLLNYGVIPIVNENDTVVTDEIRFGDNDTLAALVANLIDADALLILTDQQGLFDRDPRQCENARLIGVAYANDASLDAMVVGKSGTLGRGGMYTKLRAARLASRSGALTVIVGGRIDSVLCRLRNNENVGTMLLPDNSRQLARKQWLAGHLRVTGKLYLDDGAVNVICSRGSSLLAVGVRKCSGHFRRGEMVSCVDLKGKQVARGLVNYDADDVKKIMGKPSDKIESLLGFVNEEELIHRDNMVLV